MHKQYGPWYIMAGGYIIHDPVIHHGWWYIMPSPRCMAQFQIRMAHRPGCKALNPSLMVQPQKLVESLQKKQCVVKQPQVQTQSHERTWVTSHLSLPIHEDNNDAVHLFTTRSSSRHELVATGLPKSSAFVKCEFCIRICMFGLNRPWISRCQNFTSGFHVESRRGA